MGQWLVRTMIPGMNPRKMQQMMRKMGIQQQEIEATEVIIKTPGKDLVILNPQVSKVNMMGQESLQIVGEIHEREIKAEISDEDITTVMEQAKVDKDKAEAALKASKGDLAEAIINLQ